MKTNYKSRNTLIVIFYMAIFIFAGTAVKAKDRNFVWPIKKWQISNPKAHGINPKEIEKIIAQTSIKGNLLIVRHGYIIAEYYKNENKRDFSPNIYSCTKGIVSALIGHSIDQGYIKSIHQSVLDYFPECNVSNSDRRKRDITIFHIRKTLEADRWGI